MFWVPTDGTAATKSIDDPHLTRGAPHSEVCLTSDTCMVRINTLASHAASASCAQSACLRIRDAVPRPILSRAFRIVPSSCCPSPCARCIRPDGGDGRTHAPPPLHLLSPYGKKGKGSHVCILLLLPRGDAGGIRARKVWVGVVYDPGLHTCMTLMQHPEVTEYYYCDTEYWYADDITVMRGRPHVQGAGRAGTSVTRCNHAHVRHERLLV